MSVTSHILKLLADGGKNMDDAILVAKAMQRGDDARRIFDMVDTLESQDRSAEDRAWCLLIYAEAILRDGERSSRPANNNSAPSAYGPVACCLPCNSSKCDRLLDEWNGRQTA